MTQPSYDAATRTSDPSGPGRGSLLVLFLTVFIDLLGFGIVIPLLPIYARQFTADPTGIQLGMLMAIYSAMQFVFAPLWGRLSDHVGRRPVLMIGLASSIAFYTLFGVATTLKSFAWLFVARVGAGIAGATIPTAQAYIADTTSSDQRHKGMALIGMAFGLGFTFGPLIGYLAVPNETSDPGPAPGYVAAALSAAAFLLAVFWLPESLDRGGPRVRSPLWELRGFRAALAAPTVGLLLVATFVCVFSFANFETTLSLVLKGNKGHSGFHFGYGQVCLAFAYIGLVLAVVQGGLVRRLAGRLSETWMAVGGAIADVAGFSLFAFAVFVANAHLMLLALTLIVSGFAFTTPSLVSLVSRRSHPSQQGVIMGFQQSTNALARILGSAVGIPLLHIDRLLPYVTASALIGLGAMVILASRPASTP